MFHHINWRKELKEATEIAKQKERVALPKEMKRKGLDDEIISEIASLSL